MKRRLSVSDAEWEVLKMLWKCGESIKQPALLRLFESEGSSWKRQTLNTFLFRLEEKGLVKREKGVVSPIYGEEELSAMLMKERIDYLYGGSLSQFLASFVKINGGVNKEELEELTQLLSQNLESEKRGMHHQ